MEWLLYDCEIVNMIPDRSGEYDRRYKFCAGWSDFANMGISVIGVYSSFFDEYLMFDRPEDHRRLERLAKNSVVIGFNSKSFDDKLCAAHNIKVKTNYDLLEEVRIAAGFEASFQSVPKSYSYKLDAIARANGMAKTGSGELTPKLWQDGKKQAVIDYCRNDVKVSVEILRLGLEGKLVDPNTGKFLQLPEFMPSTVQTALDLSV